MKEGLFINMVCRKVATACVGASTVRGQGAPGVVTAARDHLSSMDVGQFAVARQSAFQRRLDAQTDALVSRFPRGARSWGAARKCVNLFLRDCLYNTYLSKHYGLARSAGLLEVPLDSLVAQELRRLDAGGSLPRWPGLKHLTPSVSASYQAFAQQVADERSMVRVHLDGFLWLDGRSRRSN